MSNSLLYLAIVAVWAVVLVPMLLRRDAAVAGGRRLRLTRRRPDELGSHDADEHGVDEHGVDEYDEAAHDDHETHLAAGPRAGGYADEPRYAPGRAGVAAYPKMGDSQRDTDRDSHRDSDGDERGRREQPAPRPVRAGRAAIIARRRRRTTGLAGLLIATVVAVSVGLGPWWTVVPPVLLLAGHLTLLRAAVHMEAERRRALARHRRREAERRTAERPPRTGDDPSAEIIDITAARQEPYDQYADAHLRAVGD